MALLLCLVFFLSFPSSAFFSPIFCFISSFDLFYWLFSLYFANHSLEVLFPSLAYVLDWILCLCFLSSFNFYTLWCVALLLCHFFLSCLCLIWTILCRLHIFSDLSRVGIAPCQPSHLGPLIFHSRLLEYAFYPLLCPLGCRRGWRALLGLSTKTQASFSPVRDRIPFPWALPYST